MCPNRTFAYKGIPMMQGHHCMDNNTEIRKVKTTESSCVHQIYTILELKIICTIKITALPYFLILIEKFSGIHLRD